MLKIQKIDRHSMVLQFLWTFDPILGRFYLNENYYFNFETLKTKIIFYYGQLRIHGTILDIRDNLHDQGSAEKDPYIVSDFEPSSIKVFSGAMRLSANISEIDKNWKNVQLSAHI